jgi:S1-C subfamily serine protease
VLPNGTTLSPNAGKVHPRWSGGLNADSDIAIMRVPGSHPAAVCASIVGAAAAALSTDVEGFDGIGTPFHVSGTVDRVAHPGGFAALISSDLAFPGGVSGGPMCGPDGVVFGIATWSAAAPLPNCFVGIPLIDLTFTWLRSHCP